MGWSITLARDGRTSPSARAAGYLVAGATWWRLAGATWWRPLLPGGRCPLVATWWPVLAAGWLLAGVLVLLPVLLPVSPGGRCWHELGSIFAHSASRFCEIRTPFQPTEKVFSAQPCGFAADFPSDHPIGGLLLPRMLLVFEVSPDGSGTRGKAPVDYESATRHQ